MELSTLSWSHWSLALLAFSLGFSKTGFPGLALVNVLIMAELFGAKESVGLILPLLIVCDVTVPHVQALRQMVSGLAYSSAQLRGDPCGLWGAFGDGQPHGSTVHRLDYSPHARSPNCSHLSTGLPQAIT